MCYLLWKGTHWKRFKGVKNPAISNMPLRAPILPHIARFSLRSGMARQRAKQQRSFRLSWKAFLHHQRRRKVRWTSSIMALYIMFLPEEKTHRQKLWRIITSQRFHAFSTLKGNGTSFIQLYGLPINILHINQVKPHHQIINPEIIIPKMLPKNTMTVF